MLEHLKELKFNALPCNICTCVMRNSDCKLFLHFPPLRFSWSKCWPFTVYVYCIKHVHDDTLLICYLWASPTRFKVFARKFIINPIIFINFPSVRWVNFLTHLTNHTYSIQCQCSLYNIVARNAGNCDIAPCSIYRYMFDICSQEEVRSVTIYREPLITWRGRPKT